MLSQKGDIMSAQMSLFSHGFGAVERIHEEIPFSDVLFPIRILLDTGASSPHTELVQDDGTPRFIRWHEQLELLYVLEGDLFCECDFRQFVCGAGDIVIVNPCEAHTFYYIEKPARYHCLMIDLKLCGDRNDLSLQKYIEPITGRSIRFHNVIRDNERVRSIIGDMIEEYRSALPGYEMAVKGDLLRLLSFLIRFETDTEDGAKQNADKHKLILPALRYIAEHYGSTITLEMLAGECCMNRSYFCRKFHEITGRTAIAYVNEYRLAKAKTLLFMTNQSVSEIAALTGFEDSSYFTRKFKELYGVSPRDMRRAESE